MFGARRSVLFSSKKRERHLLPFDFFACSDIRLFLYGISAKCKATGSTVRKVIQMSIRRKATQCTYTTLLVLMMIGGRVGFSDPPGVQEGKGGAGLGRDFEFG